MQNVNAQKGVVALAIPFLLLIIIGAVFILISQGIVKNPFPKSLQNVGRIEPTVSLQTQYQNPFDKSTQYVNPFANYKNPFDFLKK